MFYNDKKFAAVESSLCAIIVATICWQNLISISEAPVERKILE